jgi:hypothetical protein
MATRPVPIANSSARPHEHTRRAFVPVLVVTLLGLDLGVD